MLDKIEKTKIVYPHFGPTSQTHPYPIKKYLEKFSESELNPLRKHIASKLHRMHYAKQLEEMFMLYDCYDSVEEIQFLGDKTLEPLRRTAGTTNAIFSIGFILAYLFKKKANPLLISSYNSNIYGVFYMGLLGYALGRYLNSAMELQLTSKNYQDQYIVMAKAQIHSECTNLINELRFNKNEAI